MNTLETALFYFQLSNERKLEEISLLFDERTTYSSDNQGLFLGRDNIMAMMRPFFAGYHDLRWTVDSSNLIKPEIAEIEFSFEGVDQSGVLSQRRGLERIVAKDGSILHIEVRKR